MKQKISERAEAPCQRTARVSGGLIDYIDVGAGRPLVFVHGLLAGPEIWMPLVSRLSDRFRCIVPTWPLGLHRRPFDDDADMTPTGLAKAIAELLDALEIEDAVLVGCDSGAALCQLVGADHSRRLGALVLTNGDALDVFPPLMFAYLKWLTYVPGGYGLLAWVVRWLPFVRNLPFAWGGLMAKRQPALLKKWSRHLASHRGARRDAARFTRAVTPAITQAVADRLESSDLPVLIVWGRDDRHFKPALAERLAKRLANARLVWIEDAKTFVALDQPEACANQIGVFLSQLRASAASRAPRAI